MTAKTNKGFKGSLDFLIEIDKLKRMPRKVWVSLGVKNPETVMDHLYTLTLMAWVFGKDQKDIKMEKLLKMALCHEIASVKTGDLITPYNKVLPRNEEERKKVIEKWPRLSKKEKKEKYLKDYAKERRALKEITKTLDEPLADEMVSLFDEYKILSTKESRMLNQFNILAVLLEGLLRKQDGEDVSVDWLWESIYEKCDSDVCFDIMNELKRRFPQD